MKMNDEPIHIFIFPLMPKTCSMCGSSNPPCAKYCGDCGSSFIVNQMQQSDKSPDLLHQKDKDKNTRKDTEPGDA